MRYILFNQLHNECIVINIKSGDKEKQNRHRNVDAASDKLKSHMATERISKRAPNKCDFLDTDKSCK
jgi:hypothetical protein